MRLAILSLCVILTLSGCGVKPHDVDPPQGEERDHFPRTYPDHSNDPQAQAERLIRQ
jgi:uncharacterized protein YceK